MSTEQRNILLIESQSEHRELVMGALQDIFEENNLSLPTITEVMCLSSLPLNLRLEFFDLIITECYCFMHHTKEVAEARALCEHSKAVPILVYSTMNCEDEEVQTLIQDTDCEYIQKPFDMEVLLSTLARMLNIPFKGRDSSSAVV